MSNETVVPFELQMANRFIVHHPKFPSWLIKSVEVTNIENHIVQLTISVYTTSESKLSETLTKYDCDNITINILGPTGEIVDSLSYDNCEFLTSKVKLDWNVDTSNLHTSGIFAEVQYHIELPAEKVISG